MNKFTGALSDYINLSGSAKLVFLIIILIIASYINSLSVDFIWDDYSLVVTNMNIRSFSLKNIFKPLYPDDNPVVSKNPLYFRPLQILSYIFDYHIWRINPFGYHLTNIFLHTINTILIYFLILLLFKNKIMAFFGSALFGTNPVFAQSVTYISGRADILALLFTLLMIIFFAKSVQKNRLNLFYYSISLFCFILSFFSKEIGVIGILFLILSDKLIFKYGIKKIKNFIYLPYIFILFFWLYIKPPSVMGFRIAPTDIQTPHFFLLTMLKGMNIYSFLSIFPFQLRMARSITIVTAMQQEWIYISLFFLFALAALAILMRKNKLFLTGVIWFYLPLLTQFLFNALFAKRGNEILLPEHNLYFCYPGLIISASSIWLLIKPKMNIGKALIAVLSIFLIVYMCLTISENNHWQDEISFFERMITRNKNSAFNFVSYENLGHAYEKIKNFEKAEHHFKLAALTSGKNPYFYNTLAKFYLRRAEIDKALDALTLSKDLYTNFAQTYLLLGIAYIYKAQANDAKQYFEKALIIEPQNKIAQIYLEKLKSGQNP